MTAAWVRAVTFSFEKILLPDHFGFALRQIVAGAGPACVLTALTRQRQRKNALVEFSAGVVGNAAPVAAIAGAATQLSSPTGIAVR